MDYTIKSISKKKRDIDDKERSIIQQALLAYKIVLGQYEKYTDDMKRKDLERLTVNSTNTLNQLNPFVIGGTQEKSYEPSLEDTKTFVYSSWAEAIANVQTPYICDGKTKKRIRRQAFRDVKNGKFINKKVRDVMQNFIDTLSK